MSHFTVLVIGENPEEQLKPYQENNMGDCPEKYLEFHDKESSFKDEWEENKITIKKHYPSEFIQNNEYFNKLKNKGIVMFETKNSNNENKIYQIENSQKEKLFGICKLNENKNEPYNVTLVKIENQETKIRDYYSSFEEFVKDYHGYDKKDEKMNRYGYWDNVNAKWDWYVLGGRWTGFFKSKNNSGKLGEPGLMTSPPEEGYVDQAYKKDIDFESMKLELFEKASKNWEKWEEEYENDKEKAKNMSYWKYGILNEGYADNFVPESRESYIKRNSYLSTFAIVKDGEWYEKGKMEWFGISKDDMTDLEWNEKFEQLINELPEDTLLSVYDCHI